MKYQLKITNFEGPLDLLLHLIARAKIEIKDIFVSEITEQYLDFLSQEDDLDLEAASDFLQMAATLIYIKSRALLPAKGRDEDLDEEGLSPEERLIVRLQEYKKYKEVSSELKALEQEAEGVFYKLPEEVLDDSELTFANASVSALADAYLNMLARVKKQEAPAKDVVVYQDTFSVKAQIRYILARIKEAGRLTFENLVSQDPSREELAVTFLSMLELVHRGKVAIQQGQVYGEIQIVKAG